MNQTIARLVVSLFCCGLIVPTAVGQEPGEGGVAASAVLRIELPDGAGFPVSVTPGSKHIVVELPRGAVFPLDLSSSSGGLLRGGEVIQLDGERVQLKLELAAGLLDRVEYAPDSLTLRFASRFGTARDVGLGGDQYRLGPDDKLLITVHNHPELTSRPTVTRDGTITAPLVGDVDAAGLSPRELAVMLAELLGRSYLVDPQVDVEVEEFRSQWVAVTGEVEVPGRVFLRGGTRLKEVLAEAGGLTDDAGENITISRRTEESGQYATRSVERTQYESGAADPVLQHGDIIDVPRSAWCYLQGEVRMPNRIRVERGLTLLRAISMVGGLTEWADRKAVRVLYPEGTVPREQTFNIKRIQEGRAGDPPLHGGEVVIVKRRYF